MANQRARVAQAISLHLPAATTVAAVADLLKGYSAASAAAGHLAEQRELSARLRAVAAELAPGWLSAPLDALAATTPLGGSTPPTFVRIGQAQVLDDARFPVVVPLLTAGHIALDADARDPRVAGVLRALLLRLLAAAPSGSLTVRVVDSAQVGATFDAFDPRIVPPAVTDQHGLRRLLCEAESWMTDRADEPDGLSFLLVIASLPELTDGSDFARITSLAKLGPARRLHIIAAGWPPPPLTAETTQRPLPYCTQLVLRNPHAWVGDPPGASFNANGIGPGRLRAPVYLDPDPPTDLIRGTCARLVSADTPITPAPAQQAAPQAAWPRYVAAAQRLAAATKAATEITAAQEAARTAALGQLAAVSTRVARQGAALMGMAVASGAAPAIPDPRQVAALLNRLAAASNQPPATATAALAEANQALDAADAVLAGSVPTGGGRSRLSNALIYGLFALLAAVAQVPLTIATGEAGRAALLTVPCTLSLPAIAFFVAWTIIGATSGGASAGNGAVGDSAGGHDRTPLTGLAITALVTTPLVTISLLLLLTR